jgi:hypothetical protein
MPKEDFKKALDSELTGPETEPWKIIYFEPVPAPDASH